MWPFDLGDEGLGIPSEPSRASLEAVCTNPMLICPQGSSYLQGGWTAAPSNPQLREVSKDLLLLPNFCHVWKPPELLVTSYVSLTWLTRFPLKVYLKNISLFTCLNGKPITCHKLKIIEKEREEKPCKIF